jgi:hypothetical protein
MLLDEITSEMRAVTVEVNARQVTIRVYHDGLASDEAWEDFDAAMIRAEGDLLPDGTPVSINHCFIRCDSPDAVPALGDPVFARKRHALPSMNA